MGWSVIVEKGTKRTFGTVPWKTSSFHEKSKLDQTNSSKLLNIFDFWIKYTSLPVISFQQQSGLKIFGRGIFAACLSIQFIG